MVRAMDAWLSAVVMQKHWGHMRRGRGDCETANAPVPAVAVEHGGGGDDAVAAAQLALPPPPLPSTSSSPKMVRYDPTQGECGDNGHGDDNDSDGAFSEDDEGEWETAEYARGSGSARGGGSRYNHSCTQSSQSNTRGKQFVGNRDNAARLSYRPYITPPHTLCFEEYRLFHVALARAIAMLPTTPLPRTTPRQQQQQQLQPDQKHQQKDETEEKKAKEIGNDKIWHEENQREVVKEELEREEDDEEKELGEDWASDSRGKRVRGWGE